MTPNRPAEAHNSSCDLERGTFQVERQMEAGRTWDGVLGRRQCMLDWPPTSPHTNTAPWRSPGELQTGGRWRSGWPPINAPALLWSQNGHYQFPQATLYHFGGVLCALPGILIDYPFPNCDVRDKGLVDFLHLLGMYTTAEHTIYANNQAIPRISSGYCLVQSRTMKEIIVTIAAVIHQKSISNKRIMYFIWWIQKYCIVMGSVIVVKNGLPENENDDCSHNSKNVYQTHHVLH